MHPIVSTKTINHLMVGAFLAFSSVPGTAQNNCSPILSNPSFEHFPSKTIADSLRQIKPSRHNVITGETEWPSDSPYKIRFAQLLLPTLLIGTGFVGLKSDWLKYQNKEIRDELQENIDRRITVDDFTQYFPTVAFCGLSLLGCRSQHSFKEHIVLLGTAYILMGGSVNMLKVTTHVERPDKSARNSFPSGHTATAFMGAELLRREYQGRSIWIGIAGYTIAAGTSFFRMYNNRHWLTDIMAGAGIGIGILSAQAAYWLFPSVSGIFIHKKKTKIYAFPFISSNAKGLSYQFVF